MKTAVLDITAGLRRKAAQLVVALPKLDRRHGVAVALAVLVLFLGPYVVPFMLALAFFAALVAVFVALALRAGFKVWQAAVVPLAMTPFVGLVGPVDALPNWMQLVSHFFPPTYIFQGLRTLVEFGAFDSAAFVASVLLTSAYLFFVYLWASAAAPQASHGTLSVSN